MRYIFWVQRIMKEDITCYVCTLIINRKTPIIYGLNKFFIREKIYHFQISTKYSFFSIKYPKKISISFYYLLLVVFCWKMMWQTKRYILTPYHGYLIISLSCHHLQWCVNDWACWHDILSVMSSLNEMWLTTSSKMKLKKR